MQYSHRRHPLALCQLSGSSLLASSHQAEWLECVPHLPRPSNNKIFGSMVTMQHPHRIRMCVRAWGTKSKTCIHEARFGRRAVPGIEPGTSRTRSENHTTRPNSRLICAVLSKISGMSKTTLPSKTRAALWWLCVRFLAAAQQCGERAARLCLDFQLCRWP